MKRYILAVMVLGLIGVNASSNPFDLRTNLQKIDKDQDILLLELKKMAQKKEALELLEESKDDEVENENLAKETTSAEPEKREEKILSVKESNDVLSAPKKVKSDELLNAIREKVMQQELEKKKEAAQKRDAADAKEKLQREKERIKKVVQEQRKEEVWEVEAYEPKRFAKREPKTPKQVKAAVKSTLDTMKTEEKTTVSSAVDINNITHEEKVAKTKADRLYEEAVKEMDKEG